MDIKLKRHAQLITDYCLQVKKNDWVYIGGDYLIASPLIKEIYREVVKSGGYPYIKVRSNELNEIFYKEATMEQVEWMSPVLDVYLEKLNSAVMIYGSENTNALNNVDPKKQSAAAKAMSKFTSKLMQRKAAGDLMYLVTLFPCQSLAQEAEMSLSDYEDFVYNAMFCDKDDPVKEWMKLQKKQEILINFLKGKDKVEIKGEHVNLRFSIKDRIFINSAGKTNMPSGEIFTGPIENTMEGEVEFTYPAIRLGRQVDGISLKLEKGIVVDAQASKNEEFLLQMLQTDEGSKKIGEFGIGTNFGIKKFTKNILFDEKIGGTFHLAIGHGYPETGSMNHSGIHWDMICELGKNGQIIVDNEPLFKDGCFTLWNNN